jgi:2-oxoglutarate ferredoxin oxidoreductase subunit delta
VPLPPDTLSIAGKERFVMFARIEIDRSRCKGCGLCTRACPRMLLDLDVPEDETVPAAAVLLCQEKCVGCAQCAEMCPDLAISVYSRQKNEFTGRSSIAFREYSNIVMSLLEKTSCREDVLSIFKAAERKS